MCNIKPIISFDRIWRRKKKKCFQLLYKINTNCQLFHGIGLKMWQVDNFPQEHYSVLILEDIGVKYRLSTGNDNQV